jgi:protein-L-isoaspartate(D-aspartate) O-methyltransferase
LGDEEIQWQLQASELARYLGREGIDSPSVLAAIARVPRHHFLPEELRERAYEDVALPIGEDQTISQPFIVAYMTALIDAGPGRRVLEVGTGSGYQAAVLDELGAEVTSVEIVPALAERAREALRTSGHAGVRLLVGDGSLGWAASAPYDGILVTAAARAVPEALLEQLSPGGRMAIPLDDGSWSQWIWRLVKAKDGTIARERMLAVRFVPMTGAG